MRAILFTLPLLLVAGAATAQEPGAACRRDVLVAESSLKGARDALERGDSEDERCRAWRTNVATLRRAGSVFARCLAGRERAERVAEVENPARDFEGLVRERCRGR